MLNIFGGLIDEFWIKVLWDGIIYKFLFDVQNTSILLDILHTADVFEYICFTKKNSIYSAVLYDESHKQRPTMQLIDAITDLVDFIQSFFLKGAPP